MKLLFWALFESIFELIAQSRKLVAILIFLAMTCTAALLIFLYPNKDIPGFTDVPSAAEETHSSSSAPLDNENADIGAETSADTSSDTGGAVSVDTKSVDASNENADSSNAADSITQNAQVSTAEEEQNASLLSSQAGTQSGQDSTQSTSEQQLTDSNTVADSGLADSGLADSGLADSGLAVAPQTQTKTNNMLLESSAEGSDAELLVDASTESERVDAPLEMERLVIPSIDLDIPVAELGWHPIEGRSGLIFNEWDVADSAAGWHKDSAKPGEGGNVVMSGHNNVLGAVFRELDQLNQGDQAFIYAGDEIHTYAIEQILVVPELRATDEQRAENAKWIDSFDDDRLTLVSCWPRDDNTHRIIVVGHAVDG